MHVGVRLLLVLLVHDIGGLGRLVVECLLGRLVGARGLVGKVAVVLGVSAGERREVNHTGRSLTSRFPAIVLTLDGDRSILVGPDDIGLTIHSDGSVPVQSGVSR